MPNPEADLQLIRMLSERLERISADSVWAHRASGLRGSLLRVMDQFQDGKPPESDTLTEIITMGFKILDRAARHS